MKAFVNIALVLVVAGLSDGVSISGLGSKAVLGVEELMTDMLSKFSNTAGICKKSNGTLNCCVKDLVKNNICLGLQADMASFSMNVSFSVNNRTIISKKFSGQNPSPVCAPIPQVPVVKVCIQPYDLSYVAPTFNICLALGAEIFSKEVARVNLNCMQFSKNGDISFSPSSNSTSSALLKIDTGKINPLMNNTINPIKTVSSIKNKIFG